MARAAHERRSTMKTRFLFPAVTVSALMAVASSLHAQTKTEVSNCGGRGLEVQFVPINVWGDNVVRNYVSANVEFGPFSNIVEFEETRVPTTIAAGRGISFRGELSTGLGIGTTVHKCQWLLSARGWFFNGVASIEDTLRTEPGQQYYSGARMWDKLHFPFPNDRDPSGFSPLVMYSGNRSLAWTTDLLFTHRYPRASASVQVGVRLGSMNNTQVDVIQNEAYVRDYVEGTDSTPGLDGYQLSYQGAQSTADYDVLIGPLVGFAGAITTGKLRVQGSFSQSFLTGNVKYSGEWINFSDSWFVREQEDGSLAGLARLYVELERNNLVPSPERAFIPISELSLDVTFAPKRRIAFGVGVFISTWINAPRASRWSAVDSNWFSEKATVVYGGIVTSASIQFSSPRF